MSSLINKVKEKLHVGSKDKDIETYNTGSTRSEVTPHSSGVAHSSGSSQSAGANQVSPQTSATRGVQEVAGHGTHAAQGTHTHAHSAGGVASGAEGATHEPVVVHEHDPNWAKARELTHSAEQASKLSAAKAYEAESHLITAQDAHKTAQEATNRHAELAAQAEAERQNIGQADYLHKEVDKYKNKIEDREKIHVELNRNLDHARQLVNAKEGEFSSVAPVVQTHQKEIGDLTNKLESLQGAKAKLETKHSKHAAALGQLQDQHGEYAQQVSLLEAEVERLNLHANELEQQARAARAAADEKLKHLQSVKGEAATIAKEADRTARNIQLVQKDLQGYQSREAELSQRLTAAQAAAKDAADLAAAKEAELQLAKQQYDAEQAKGLPVAQDIERYRKEVEEKERQYQEAYESSKAAKAAYERFSAEAAAAAKEAAAAQELKGAKLDSYKQLKLEAQEAKDRETSLWEEAKKHGNTGDVNALQRLAEAEKNLAETHGAVDQPIVVPQVGPKTPTTEGPKIHRSEDVREHKDNVSRENVSTKY